jgi:serine/threonine-protein kinase
MAPEMLGDTSTPISEQTDVYLLGSILYEIVVGHAPHRGTTLPQIVGSILASPPPIPDEIPSELERILLRAMDLDPHARFENPAQVRLAIDGFLQHRGSRRLSQEAERRFGKLITAIADDEASPTQERNLEIHKLYAECRFGFREALTLWRDNDGAISGLRSAAQAMIDYELGRGDAKAASALLAALDSPPAELRERVERALAEKVSTENELAALRVDLDRNTGSGTRTALGVILGMMWTLIPLGAYFMRDRLPVLAHWRLVIAPLLLLAVALPLGVWAIRVLRATALNRALARAVVLVFITQATLAAGLMLSGASPETSLTMYPFVSFVASAMLAVTVEPWLFASAIGFFGAFLLTAWKPEHRYLLMSASNFLFVLNIVAFRVFGPVRDDRRQIPARRSQRREG